MSKGWLGVLLLVLAATACAPLPAPRAALSADAYPGALVDPETLGRDFMWRQSITATFRKPGGGQDSASFEAVVQKHGDTLSVLGLTPFGSRAFLLQQRGQQIELQRFVAGDLPIPPRFVLIDIHRTFFRGLSAPLADGESSGVLDGERVNELHRAGLLQWRTFERIDGHPKGTIRITYQGGKQTGADSNMAPPVVTFDNGWFGYRLVIKTVSQRLL